MLRPNSTARDGAGRQDGISTRDNGGGGDVQTPRGHQFVVGGVQDVEAVGQARTGCVPNPNELEQVQIVHGAPVVYVELGQFIGQRGRHNGRTGDRLGFKHNSEHRAVFWIGG